MNPETDIICLEIVKGIPKAPGDTESAEQDLVILDLLDANGLSVQVDGWTLALPGIKRGGTWTDTQITDGRTLIAAPKENVTETIQLAIGNQDLIQRYQLFTKLQRLADDARAFWAEGYQIEPVYLKFKANGARVYQYALIYNISIADASDPYEIAEAVEVTLVIEREVAWRMVVSPGGNPLEYWFYTQGKTRGVDYDWEDMSLIANSDHFVYDHTDNACEMSGLDHATFLTRSWVDIDGSTIPGDAPALLYTVFDETNKMNQWHLARDTRPRRRYDRQDGDYDYHRNVLNAGDATGASTPTIDACGVWCRSQIANRYISAYAKAAGPDAAFTPDVLIWDAANAFIVPFLLNQMSGNWAVFLRCQQTDGAEGDVELRLRVRFGDTASGAIVTTMDRAFAPYRTTPGACVGEFDIVYMGRVSIPTHSRPVARTDGVGYAADDANTWTIYLDVLNNAAAIRHLEFLDLWFMPLDEGYCIYNPDSTTAREVGAANAHHMVDNTGYLLRGYSDDMAAYSDGTTVCYPNPIELLGSALTLKPGVDNRVYMLRRYFSTNPYSPGEPGAVGGGVDAKVRMNIVPRCYGIADI